jgi:hypothetical protein
VYSAELRCEPNFSGLLVISLLTLFESCGYLTLLHSTQVSSLSVEGLGYVLDGPGFDPSRKQDFLSSPINFQPPMQ